MKKYMIWSNDVDAMDMEMDYIKEEYPELSETEQWDLLYDNLDVQMNAERCNLNLPLSQEIILIGTVGRWNGTFSGYKLIESGNIRDCLYSDCDYSTWYCDRYNMRYEGIHHDGRNRGLYRVFRDGLTEEQKEHFLNMVYFGKCNDRMIRRYTKSIRPCIAAVYGWN